MPKPHKIFKSFVREIKPDINGVEKLIKKINKMIVAAKSNEAFEKAYNQPAEEFVKSGKIPVKMRKGRSLAGCYQQSQVLYYSLKALGFNPKLTRFFFNNRPHTTVLFTLKGKLYEADSFRGTISLVDNYRREQIKEETFWKNFKIIEPNELTYQDFKKQKKRIVK